MTDQHTRIAQLEAVLKEAIVKVINDRTMWSDAWQVWLRDAEAALAASAPAPDTEARKEVMSNDQRSSVQRPPATSPGVTAGAAREAARYLLTAYDTFMSGAEMTPDQREADRMVRNGVIYGAAAFEAALDRDQGAHAMIRSVLLAMIDPLHPDLDYLRADPAAGQAARDASTNLDQFQKTAGE